MAQITIPLYYDLDLLLWTSAAGGIARQPNLVLGQSDEIDFAVQFVQGGVGVNLPPISSIICGIKAINDVSGVYLANTTSFTQTGDGATRVYTFTLLLDSDELRAWLLTVTAVSNYAAFSILSAEHKIATLPAITCTILPDYNLTGTTPTAASGTLIVDSGQTFTVHKTFAMPVDDGTDTYVLKTNGAGVGRWAADTIGTGTVTSVGQSFTGGIVSVSGTPVTASGTLALTILGTQGGIVYFATNSTWASSGAMGQGSLIVGGSAGSPPSPVSAQTAGKVLISNGVTTNPIYSSIVTLGASGTLGTIAFGNATALGGILTITPPTGSYSSATITLPNAATTLAGLAIAQTFTASQTLNTTTADNTGLITIKYNGTTKGLIGYRTTDLAGLQITGAAGSGGFQITDSQTRWFTNGGGAATATLADGVGLSITGTGNGKNLSVAGTTTVTGLLTANGGVTVASGQVLKLGNAATTGLTAGVLAATTNATLTITDSMGQVYRIPCII